MIFYERPVALNRAAHLGLKLDSKPGDFSFAAKTNSVLLAATEIAEAAKDYPILFVGQAGGPFSLAAMVGLRDSENLFVDADGAWTAGAYLPAFARRYPFVLAETDNVGEDLTVCIDEAYAALNDERGEALFDADGKESPLLQNAVEFLKLFHAEMQTTRLFVQKLVDYDLLVQKSIQIQHQDRQAVLDGLFVVDQERLQALDDAQALDLFRSGALYWIHAHLLSLKNVERLALRLAQAAPEAASTAAPEIAGSAAPERHGKSHKHDKSRNRAPR